MYYYDLIGLGLVLLGAVLSMIAQITIRSMYSAYSEVYTKKNLSGAEVAREILYRHGLDDVHVSCVDGFLTDHYDPSRRVVRLSKDIYYGTSISAVAVASHECGHAIQHQESYAPMNVRSALVPVCNVCEYAGWAAILIGLWTSLTNIAWAGIFLMCMMIVFQLVTLPVEFDASSRALKILSNGYLDEDEMSGAKKVLFAAALTYVAGLITTILQLLRIVLMVAGRNRD